MNINIRTSKQKPNCKRWDGEYWPSTCLASGGIAAGLQAQGIEKLSWIIAYIPARANQKKRKECACVRTCGAIIAPNRKVFPPPALLPSLSSSFSASTTRRSHLNRTPERRGKKKSSIAHHGPPKAINLNNKPQGLQRVASQTKKKQQQKIKTKKETKQTNKQANARWWRCGGGGGAKKPKEEKRRNMEQKLVAEVGFDPTTCGLWAHHASRCATLLTNNLPPS